MQIDQETEDRLKQEVDRLDRNGLTQEEIKRRLESCGFPQSLVDQLVKLPKAASIPTIQEKPDLLELVDSLAIFLDDNMKKLWDYHGQGQYETLVTLDQFRKRLLEATDAHRN